MKTEDYIRILKLLLPETGGIDFSDLKVENKEYYKDSDVTLCGVCSEGFYDEFENIYSFESHQMDEKEWAELAYFVCLFLASDIKHYWEQQ